MMFGLNYRLVFLGRWYHRDYIMYVCTKSVLKTSVCNCVHFTVLFLQCSLLYLYVQHIISEHLSDSLQSRYWIIKFSIGYVIIHEYAGPFFPLRISSHLDLFVISESQLHQILIHYIMIVLLDGTLFIFLSFSFVYECALVCRQIDCYLY